MELLVSTKQKFEFLYNLIDAKKQLLIVVPVVIFSAGKHLYFHDNFLSVLSSLFKV